MAVRRLGANSVCVMSRCRWLSLPHAASSSRVSGFYYGINWVRRRTLVRCALVALVVAVSTSVSALGSYTAGVPGRLLPSPGTGSGPAACLRGGRGRARGALGLMLFAPRAGARGVRRGARSFVRPSGPRAGKELFIAEPGPARGRPVVVSPAPLDAHDGAPMLLICHLREPVDVGAVVLADRASLDGATHAGAAAGRAAAADFRARGASSWLQVMKLRGRRRGTWRGPNLWCWRCVGPTALMSGSRSRAHCSVPRHGSFSGGATTAGHWRRWRAGALACAVGCGRDGAWRRCGCVIFGTCSGWFVWCLLRCCAASACDGLGRVCCRRLSCRWGNVVGTAGGGRGALRRSCRSPGLAVVSSAEALAVGGRADCRRRSRRSGRGGVAPGPRFGFNLGPGTPSKSAVPVFAAEPARFAAKCVGDAWLRRSGLLCWGLGFATRRRGGAARSSS